MKPSKLLRFSSIAVFSLFISMTARAEVNEQSVDFVQKAFVANKFEVESSRKALQKSKNSAVRDFARRMITDHRKANEQLRDVLQIEELLGMMTLPLDLRHEKILNSLTLSGLDSFDSDYIDAQEALHKDALALVKDYSENGDNMRLQRLADRWLPTLQHHQRMVNDLKKNYQNGYTVSQRDAVESSILEPAAGGDMINPRYNSFLPP